MLAANGELADSHKGHEPLGTCLHHEQLLKAGKGQITPYPKAECREKTRAALDPNHSHFIMVDDGTVGNRFRSWQLTHWTESL